MPIYPTIGSRRSRRLVASRAFAWSSDVVAAGSDPCVPAVSVPIGDGFREVRRHVRGCLERRGGRRLRRHFPAPSRRVRPGIPAAVECVPQRFRIRRQRLHALNASSDTVSGCFPLTAGLRDNGGVQESTAAVRIDQWLWAARFFKTRALAKQAVDAGRVQIGNATCKPARPVRVGDALNIRRGDENFEIEVLAVSGRRGSAVVAQSLYRESEESRTRRLEALAQRKAERAGFKPPDSRPDKRARRLIRALGDIEMM